MIDEINQFHEHRGITPEEINDVVYIKNIQPHIFSRITLKHLRVLLVSGLVDN